MAAARSEVLYERRQGRVKLLLVRGLNVYYGNVQVLFDVDFEIDEGEIVALLGTNGAGQVDAAEGHLRGGRGRQGRGHLRRPRHHPRAAERDRRLRHHPGARRPGRVPEPVGGREPAGGRLARPCARGRWARSGSQEVLELFPVLRSRLAEPAANLSGGQQQMLALGMAFLARPRLLLIDELCLGLAPVIVEQLLPIVERDPPAGHDGHPGRAVGEPGPHHRRDGVLHGEGRDPVPRPDRRAARAARRAALGVPRRRRRPPARSPSAPPTATHRPPTAAPTVAGNGSGRRRTATATAVDANGTGRPTARGRPWRRWRRPSRPSAPSPALEVGDVTVRFGGIQAVGDVSLRGRAGRDRRHHRAERRRQDHAVRPHLRLHPGRRRSGAARRPATSPAARPTGGPGSGSVGRSRTPASSRRSRSRRRSPSSLDRWVDVKDPINAALRLPASFDSEQAVAAPGRRADRAAGPRGVPHQVRARALDRLAAGRRPGLRGRPPPVGRAARRAVERHRPARGRGARPAAAAHPRRPRRQPARHRARHAARHRRRPTG